VGVFGHRHATITRWLTRAGTHSATLHDRTFRHLEVPHIQFDELRTLKRCRAHTLWLWVAVDPLSKIMVVLRLGPRTQDAAHRVVHDLSGRLAPGCIPIFTSDGLNHSFYALTAHFGQWVAGVGRQARQWLLRSGAALWPGEKDLSTAEARTRDRRTALRDTCRIVDRFTATGVQRTIEHRIR